MIWLLFFLLPVVLLDVSGSYRVNLPNYLHTDPAAGTNKNAVFGRAFVSKLLDFDGDENNSSCYFDFAKESTHLREMQIDKIARIPKDTILGTVLSIPLKLALSRFSRDACKRFGVWWNQMFISDKCFIGWSSQSDPVEKCEWQLWRSDSLIKHFNYRFIQRELFRYSDIVQ